MGKVYLIMIKNIKMVVKYFSYVALTYFDVLTIDLTTGVDALKTRFPELPHPNMLR